MNNKNHPNDGSAGSSIINLLRTRSLQDKKNQGNSNDNTTTTTNNHSSSLEALIGSLNQRAIAQAAAAASTLQFQSQPQFLPSRLQSQRDLLLLKSLQQHQNSSSSSSGLFGYGFSAPSFGALGLPSSLSPLNSIDAALMPSLNTQPQRINPSALHLMANLQHNAHHHHHHQLLNPGKVDTVDTSKRSESFPEKLHRLLREVEQEGLSDIISFTHDGRAFQIHKPKQFFDKIVPRYFNQSHLSSFKRQLNLYGFEALSSGPLKGAYYHADFLKLRPELCKLIHRRNQKWRAPEK